MGILQDNIKHVVILMQENRSFDEYFGTFPGATGFNDPNGVFSKQYVDGNGKEVKPFRMSTFTASGLQRDQEPHDWATFQYYLDQIKQNKPDWAQSGPGSPKEGATGPSVPTQLQGNTTEAIMGYYAANDIPFHWALAETFTLCDHYFASALAGTGPNRAFLMSGCIQNPDNTVASDPNGSWSGPMQDNIGGATSLNWPTYANMLNPGQWAIYNEGGAAPSGADSNYPPNCPSLGDFIGNFGSLRNLPASNLKLTGAFESDCQTGNLPLISWITPPGWASEWEDCHMAQGAAYIAGKLNAILTGVEKDMITPLWNSTVFIINYDEAGGHFDHVDPNAYVAPPGTPGEYVGSQPAGPGFRTPAFIISPWTVNTGIYSQPLDHTSVLQFLEQLTGVLCVSDGLDFIDSWRRSTFGNPGLIPAFNNFNNFVPATEFMGINNIFPWTIMQTGQYRDNAYIRYTKNQNVALTSPTVPYFPPVTQSCEIIMPMASYDYSYIKGLRNNTVNNGLQVQLFGFELDELTDLNAMNQVFSNLQINSGPQTLQTRFPAITFSGLNGGSIIASPVSINYDTTITAQPGLALPFITINYNLVFSDLTDLFPQPQEPTTPGGPVPPEAPTKILINATFQVDASFTASSELELVNTQDPQFYPDWINNTSWLSGELRVFSVPVGYELFGVTLETPSPSKSYAKCACDFITKLIGTLNKNGGENLPSTVFPPESGISISKFDDLNYMEEVNPLYLTSTDANGNIVFNFALARVHMNSTAQAQNVRVFFRSCRASVTTSIYNPVGDLTTNSFYRSNPPNLNDPGTNDLRIPLLGVDYVTPATSGPPTLEYVNIPFFATPRVNPNTTSMLTQPKDSPNVQDIPNGNLNNHPMAFFGCWLDINLDRSEDQIFLQFDNVPGVSQWDGGWNLPANSNQLVSIYKSFIRDNHQCLVAEISFDGIDIPAGDVPGYSAWLAQRNLGFIQ